jgi:mono/diheme cytochrome c family protein
MMTLRCRLAGMMLIASLAVSLAVYAHGDWKVPVKAAGRKNPVVRDEASIVRGQELYRIHCAECHGATGRGDGPKANRMWPRPTDLLQMAGHHPDGDFAWKIETGRGDMPGFKRKLKPKEIWDLVNYTQSLKP